MLNSNQHSSIQFILFDFAYYVGWFKKKFIQETICNKNFFLHFLLARWSIQYFYFKYKFRLSDKNRNKKVWMNLMILIKMY